MITETMHGMPFDYSDVQEAVYHTDTLLKRPEIQEYGLHDDVIRAILNDNQFHTLAEAISLIHRYLDKEA